MNAPRRLVTDEAKALIGYNTPPRTTADLVPTSDVRRFAPAIMDDNPVFFDEDAAGRSRRRRARAGAGGARPRTCAISRPAGPCALCEHESRAALAAFTAPELTVHSGG